MLREINDVLDLSKIESDHMQLENRLFNLVNCAEDALETVSSATPAKVAGPQKGAKKQNERRTERKMARAAERT